MDSAIEARANRADTASSGVCAIVKGIYVNQLRLGDFSYNGKDVTIWTAVETATAIIAASIPVLRVFFKDKISSYDRSHGRSDRDGSKPVPLSNLSRGQHTVGKSKEAGWTTLEPIGDISSRSSRVGILRDEGGLLPEEEQVARRDSLGAQDRNVPTYSYTVTAGQDRRSQRQSRHWLGGP